MVEEKTGKLDKRRLPIELRISIKASQAKKGEDLLIIDLRGIATFTDFFIIMHGNSTRQNIALYENIKEELKKRDIQSLSIEGKEHGEWILMDYGSFIVHVFSKGAREYYSLEKLWGDAPRISY
ncbi:MAG: ribosome silencing factor [candidate division Zixibacteria bacterium SM23_73]|nr:MAG: ribosome silencing factor [candidate division Zixibacteria bacterium SM23_73]